MAKRRKKNERVTIALSPNRRPYGARLVLLLEEQTNFNIDGECTFLVTPEIHLRIRPKKLGYDENCWDVFVEGFSTAGEAEEIGLKVALGFLWTAIQGHYSARLLYHTPLPCFVYDRTQSNGIMLSDSVTMSVTKGIESIVHPLDSVIVSHNKVDPQLLVALEIFTAARLETTERAKFIGIISAIEPIAVQKKYEDEKLAALLANFKEQLNSSELDQNLITSLCGRIDQLRLESVSRAIRRLVENYLPNDPEAVSIIEEAYNLRSKILHEGSTDADLQEKSQETEEIIRKIFELKISEYTGCGN